MVVLSLHSVLAVLGVLSAIANAQEIPVGHKPTLLEQSMSGVLLSAEWYKVNGEISSIFLNNDQGNCSILFSSTFLRQAGQKLPFRHVVNRVTFLLYDPIYSDQGMIHLEIDLKGFFVEEQNEWVGKSESNVVFFKQGARMNRSTLPVEFRISKTQSKLVLNGVTLETRAKTVNRYDFIGIIVMLSQFTMIGILQFTSTSKITSVSKIGIVALMVNQLSSSFVYFYLSFTAAPQYSIVLLFSGAFSIACFLRILQKYTSTIQIKMKWEKLVGLAMVLYIYSHLVWYSFWIFNLINCLTLVPQIVENIQSKTLKLCSFKHVVCLFLVNNIFPVYLQVSNVNILRLTPNQSAGYLMILLIVLQILAMSLHITLRKYSRKLKSRLFQAKPAPASECSICLASIQPEELVTTPCQHTFHQQCVVKWLKYKRTCPMDRNKLSISDLST